MLAVPSTTQATHESTQCKWDFPWPRTIWYWINTGAGQFSSSHATRVSYGNNTWTEAGFNLLFQRTTNRDAATNYTEHFKGSASSTTIAFVRVSPTSSCNRDAGNPITRVENVWNNQKNFHSDCLAAGTQWCVNNQYYDIHNVSAHEVGHWFFIANETTANDVGHTMYKTISYGETLKRSLAQHDKDSAEIMYGFRSGYNCN